MNLRKISAVAYLALIIFSISACFHLDSGHIEVSFFPFDAVVGATATFQCVSSALPGTVDAYTWDFGDGNTGEGQAVTHQYNAPGDFTVTCEMTNGSTTRTLTTTVTINAGFGGGAIGSFIYWVDLLGDEKIYRCDISGGNPCTSRTLVADIATSGLDVPSSIRIDGNFLYWANIGTGRILRCDITGSLPCASEVVTGAVELSRIDIDGNFLYYTDEKLDGKQVLRCDISGAMPCNSFIVADENTLNTEIRGSIQVEDRILTWQPRERHTVYACSIALTVPCESKVLIVRGSISESSEISSYFRQGPNIIWADSDRNELRGCSVGNEPCLSTLVADSGTSGVDSPGQVHWIGTTVYWGQRNSVWRCDVFSGSPCTSSVVLDDTSGPISFLGNFFVVP